MKLNSLSPAAGSKKVARRVGRGSGSGLGKTAGRGHKGQKSRSGGYHKVGFEGGQMPIQRRLPKVGFTSRVNRFAVEVRTSELNRFEGDVDLTLLKTSGVVANWVDSVKVMLSGEITSKVNLIGIKVTHGAKAAIEAAGGSVAV